MTVRNLALATLALVYLCTLTACAEKKIAMADDKAKGLIVGEWTADIKDGRVDIVATQTYRADGTYTIVNKMALKAGDGQVMHSTITDSGTWIVRDGILTTTLKESSAPELKSVGFVSSNRIERLDPTGFEFVDGSGRPIRSRRVTAQ
ncbi:MAG: hypothetical protein ACI9MR_000815 [Myxococcota bacterium]|jgi:hypothetical protein